MDYSNSRMRWLITEYVHHERNRAILLRRYLDGICYEPLAEEFDMSVRQVQNIDYRFRRTVLVQHASEL